MGNHIPMKNCCLSEVRPSSIGCLKLETLLHMSERIDLGWPGRTGALLSSQAAEGSVESP